VAYRRRPRLACIVDIMKQNKKSVDDKHSTRVLAYFCFLNSYIIPAKRIQSSPARQGTEAKHKVEISVVDVAHRHPDPGVCALGQCFP
jgi:hypothetical protein